MIGLQSFSSLQHCSTLLQETGQCYLGPEIQRQSVASGGGGPAVHFPSWTQTSVSSRLLAQENSNSWIQFRPLQSAATQKCNNVFFLVNIGLVFSIDDSEADFTVSWLRRSQTSLCPLIKVRLWGSFYSARLRPLTSSWDFRSNKASIWALNFQNEAWNYFVIV